MALSTFSFTEGDFVFAKMKGWPKWPAVIRETDKNKVLVDFFDKDKTW